MKFKEMYVVHMNDHSSDIDAYYTYPIPLGMEDEMDKVMNIFQEVFSEYECVIESGTDDYNFIIDFVKKYMSYNDVEKWIENQDEYDEFEIHEDDDIYNPVLYVFPGDNTYPTIHSIKKVNFIENIKEQMDELKQKIEFYEQFI